MEEDSIPTFQCPICHTPNYIGHRFCVNCGQNFRYKCPNCGHLVNTTLAVCPQCRATLTWSRSESKETPYDEMAEPPTEVKFPFNTEPQLSTMEEEITEYIEPTDQVNPESTADYEEAVKTQHTGSDSAPLEEVAPQETAEPAPQEEAILLHGAAEAALEQQAPPQETAEPAPQEEAILLHGAVEATLEEQAPPQETAEPAPQEEVISSHDTAEPTPEQQIPPEESPVEQVLEEPLPQEDSISHEEQELKLLEEEMETYEEKPEPQFAEETSSFHQPAEQQVVEESAPEPEPEEIEDKEEPIVYYFPSGSSPEDKTPSLDRPAEQLVVENLPPEQKPEEIQPEEETSIQYFPASPSDEKISYHQPEEQPAGEKLSLEPEPEVPGTIKEDIKVQEVQAFSSPEKPLIYQEPLEHLPDNELSIDREQKVSPAEAVVPESTEPIIADLKEEAIKTQEPSTGYQQPEQPAAARCFYHPERRAGSICPVCEKPVCSECYGVRGGVVKCLNCYFSSATPTKGAESVADIKPAEPVQTQVSTKPAEATSSEEIQKTGETVTTAKQGIGQLLAGSWKKIRNLTKRETPQAKDS